MVAFILRRQELHISYRLSTLIGYKILPQVSWGGRTVMSDIILVILFFNVFLECEVGLDMVNRLGEIKKKGLSLYPVQYTCCS